MRVLLDACLPRGLKKCLREHDVKTVPEAGWAGMKNGELLRIAAGNVDAFVTIDSNLAYQQTVTGLSFGVVPRQLTSPVAVGRCGSKLLHRTRSRRFEISLAPGGAWGGEGGRDLLTH